MLPLFSGLEGHEFAVYNSRWDECKVTIIRVLMKEWSPSQIEDVCGDTEQSTGPPSSNLQMPCASLGC